MLATEPARIVVHSESNSKNDLIDRGVLPYSYRNRQIALVTARGVFKEFGAKIIRGGKHITDDYYASELRTKGM
ncbi:CGH_1_HP_G0101370.mRNA.1.CDS.1 [Saccharomyces cerevisiae]|nr:CGH_1_HP_G0101370.mRNA.1.CDS.1 [Saccharomyces cerevisiae]CAI6948334.1 CGH_1_HP_G0101370.mRNA.1.CDS.1 [Saccharomyces cerevisiae]